MFRIIIRATIEVENMEDYLASDFVKSIDGYADRLWEALETKTDVYAVDPKVPNSQVIIGVTEEV